MADGPSIPDELLLARDQGRVIFFCGAGVSRAFANLPDFFGLAETVIEKLGVAPDSAAYTLVREAQEIDRRVGISGVISADRVFGLLERDFPARDLEEAVASALKPRLNCNLRAHRTLLDLATTPQGAVLLVTTNFDRLFDDCRSGLKSWQPPRLPDPLRPNDIDGVIYLHGKANPDYTGAEGDGFVLSSSEFGRAYLSDGWATSFVRGMLNAYVVVFVGYTADDPPVQYLLEALRKANGKLENAYAFQAGGHSEAIGRWRHKGVEAIPYNDNNAHAALWHTLDEWAVRARDPDTWHSNVINLAKKGPSELKPHERGQVAHLVSTYEGMKKFCAGDAPPPAEWLCVFDAERRFAKPGRCGSFGKRDRYVDPFNLYGLDCDVPPSKVDPEDFYAKRETPTDAWDVFRLNRLDRAALRDDNLSSLQGHWASVSPRLVPRINQLGSWIAQVCDQPAAPWWAAHQVSLHKNVREYVGWELDRSTRSIPSQIRQAWHILFEAWEHPKRDFDNDWYDLNERIDKDGWSSAAIRKFGRICRPYLSTEPAFLSGPKPPTNADVKLEQLVQRTIAYPEIHEQISIPDEWCVAVSRTLRENLERALVLETEIGGYGLYHISPIVPADEQQRDSHQRNYGLSGAVIRYSSIFSQLVEVDVRAAHQEFQSWSSNDETIFARLKIWASGKKEIVPATAFRRVFTELNGTIFWNSCHQRDLLLVLARRWGELNSAARKSFERRLLKGPKRRKGEKLASFRERRAWSILNRIHWLANAGCTFSFNIDEVTSSLHSFAPKWKPEFAATAAESLESQGGWVKTETNHDALRNTPLPLILSQAEEQSRRSDDFLTEYDPFAGLAANRPALALAALTHAAKHGDFPQWAWQRFLSPEARKNDKAKFSRLIAERLVRYPEDQLAKMIGPAADWIQAASGTLAKNCVGTFDNIVPRLIGVLHARPEEGASGIVRGSSEPDWTMEAINSPTGKIAQALFNDPRTKNLKSGQGLPDRWLNHAKALLSLPGDLRRHTLVILFHNLNWFYAVDPVWAETNLLPVFDSSDIHDRDAAWSGFLWGARTPSFKLYARLKDRMIAYATTALPSRRSYVEIIAGMILAGWGSVDDQTGESCISNREMRSLLLNAGDEFRSRVLWQAERWANETREDSHERWKNLLPQLLRIWPRQISAKSPNTSARLCELAFSNAEQFVLIAELILPLLTKIERDHLRLPNLQKSQNNIVDQYPVQTLALLYAVLPDNARSWPTGIDGTLRRIGDADKALNMDERLIELKRRWDAR